MVADRRRHKLFGVSFSIPLPWLVTIIVVGLVQMGVMYNQFVGMSDSIKEIKSLVLDNATKLVVQTQIDHEQDRRLEGLERRR